MNWHLPCFIPLISDGFVSLPADPLKAPTSLEQQDTTSTYHSVGNKDMTTSTNAQQVQPSLVSSASHCQRCPKSPRCSIFHVQYLGNCHSSAVERFTSQKSYLLAEEMWPYVTWAPVRHLPKAWSAANSVCRSLAVYFPGGWNGNIFLHWLKGNFRSSLVLQFCFYSCVWAQDSIGTFWLHPD